MPKDKTALKNIDPHQQTPTKYSNKEIEVKVEPDTVAHFGSNS